MYFEYYWLFGITVRVTITSSSSVIPLRTEEDTPEENPSGSKPRIPSVELSFSLGVLAVQTPRNPRGEGLEAQCQESPFSVTRIQDELRSTQWHGLQMATYKTEFVAEEQTGI